jgi:hypothetical protein
MRRVSEAAALVLTMDTNGVPAAVKDPKALDDPVELGKAAFMVEVRLELENRLSELDGPNAELEKRIMLIKVGIELEVGMAELDVTRLLVELDREVEVDSRIGKEEVEVVEVVEAVEVVEGFDEDMLVKELKLCT